MDFFFSFSFLQKTILIKMLLGVFFLDDSGIEMRWGRWLPWAERVVKWKGPKHMRLAELGEMSTDASPLNLKSPSFSMIAMPPLSS